MNRLIFFLLVLISSPSFAQNFTAAADAFLKKHVTNGSVAYSKIKQNMAEIESLYTQIGEQKFDGQMMMKKRLQNMTMKCFQLQLGINGNIM